MYKFLLLHDLHDYCKAVNKQQLIYQQIKSKISNQNSTIY